MILNSISDRLVGALSDTLLHSLWQGVLLAAIAGLIVIGTRKTSPALRYNLLISTLLLFALSVSVTFALQYEKHARPTVARQQVQYPHYYNVTAMTDPVTQPAMLPHPGLTTQIYSYLNTHHDTIVLIWFLIICTRSLQLGIGLYGTYRLKHVRVNAVTGQWADRMQQLAGTLGIRQAIALLESGLAKAPMVIGHLKPVILVPVGLLTALAPPEVEAILIHELAHVIRRDYLVNMLQNLLDVLFFFNPGVLWISRLIRAERENCCDDLAIEQNAGKANYIRALVCCEEYQSSIPSCALAFAGNRNTLLYRVRRMAGNRNHSLNLFEKTVLTVCLVGTGLFIMAFSASESAPVHPIRPVSTAAFPPKSQINAATTPTTRQTAHKNPHPTNAPAQVPANPKLRYVQPSASDTSPYYNNRPYEEYRRKYYDLERQYASDEAEIKADLIKDGLVSDTNHIYFTLNPRGFILNGKPQSAEVLQWYKTKYIPPNSGNWTWNHSTCRGPSAN